MPGVCQQPRPPVILSVGVCQQPRPPVIQTGAALTEAMNLSYNKSVSNKETLVSATVFGPRRGFVSSIIT